MISQRIVSFALSGLLVKFLVFFVVVIALHQAAFADGADRYRLGPGDQISITVLNEANLSLQLRLSDQGTLSYPILGVIRASGKTTEELESIIRQGLQGKYLMDPQVSVNIIEFRKYFVSGAVKGSGAFPFVPGLTVQQAITNAGGFAENSSNEIMVIRENDPAGEARPITMQSLIQPGDHLEVREAGEIMVEGSVKNPGVIPFKRGMTVQKAIASAGGLTEDAADTVMVISSQDAQRKPEPRELHAVIEPGDHIEVPRAGEIIVEGAVQKPGVYPYKRGLTVHKAIALAGGPNERASRDIVVIHESDPEHQAVEVDPFSPVQPGDIIHVEESFF